MRFFFHTDFDTRFRDADGEELPSIEDARTAGAEVVAEMLRDRARKFWGCRPWKLTVTDAGGGVFFTIEVHGQEAAAAG